jgi:hypothetical protein
MNDYIADDAGPAVALVSTERIVACCRGFEAFQSGGRRAMTSAQANGRRASGVV